MLGRPEPITQRVAKQLLVRQSLAKKSTFKKEGSPFDEKNVDENNF